jgi:hypothetical protein
MTEITTSEILISDLPTKQVTLAPQQVTIVREIPTTIQVSIWSSSDFYFGLFSSYPSLSISSTTNDIVSSCSPAKTK